MGDISEINKYDLEFNDEFEDWEIYTELHEKKRYSDLVKFCEQRFNKYPDDPYSQYYLGAAYVLNNQYEKAIEFISKYYYGFPENIDFQHIILDALFALGKDENDFNWTMKPSIIRLSNKIVDDCYKYLKLKRKEITINDLYFRFEMKGYLLFNEKDLLKELRNDNRFIITDYCNENFANIQVVSK